MLWSCAWSVHPVGLPWQWGPCSAGPPLLREPTPSGARQGAAMRTHTLTILVTSIESDADKYPPRGPQWMADIYFSLRLS